MKRIKWNLLIMLLLLLTACSTKPPRIDYQIPASTLTYSSWEEIFAHPVDVSVHTWNTANMDIPSKGVYNSKYPNAPALEKTITIPVPVFYLEFADGRGFLIDAGVDRAMIEGSMENVRGLLRRMVIPQVKGEKSNSVVERLESTGLPLDALLLTHMHFDHTGGLADLPDDTRVLAGKGEQPIEIPLLFRATHLDRLSRIEEINYSHAAQMAPFTAVVDLLGDGSVFAIHTPGHTTGHTSYLVNSTRGVFFISGDQLNIRENREFEVPPGSYSNDLEQAERSFRQIMEFLKTYPQVHLLMGHDIEQ